MGCATVSAGAEDCVRSVAALDCRTAGIGTTSVTCGRDVAEIQTPRALQQIAADRCHIAQLRRSAELQGLADHRNLLPDNGMSRQIRHSHQGSNTDHSGLHVDRLVGQRIDIHQRIGTFDRLTHQVDQSGTAGYVAATGRGCPQRGLLVGGLAVAKWKHGLVVSSHRCDSFDDVRVGTATTEIATHPLAYFRG